MNYVRIAFTALFTFSLSHLFAQNIDWLSWRGPSADGTVAGTDWDLGKIRSGKGILWKTSVGTGHSAVAVCGDSVYTMGNFELADGTFIDRVVCLDARNGQMIWKYDFRMKEGEDPGPFSTPVLDENRLFTLSRGGDLYCFHATDGKILWKRNLVSDGLVASTCEFACSPLIIGDLLILNINRSGLALNKQTGTTAWTSEVDNNSLSTAVPFRNNGKLYITTQTNDETYVLDPLTGKEIWRIAKGFITDPIMVNGKMVVFSYKGSKMYDITKDPPELTWDNPLLKARFQSFVHKEGHAYGWINQGGDRLVCFDLATGNINWSQKLSAGSLVLSGRTLIVIDKEGMLRFIDASPDDFSELASIRAIDLSATDTKGRNYRRESACWTNPVLCNRKIYVRSTYGDLTCIDVSP